MVKFFGTQNEKRFNCFFLCRIIWNIKKSVNYLKNYAHFYAIFWAFCQILFFQQKIDQSNHFSVFGVTLRYTMEDTWHSDQKKGPVGLRSKTSAKSARSLAASAEKFQRRPNSIIAPHTWWHMWGKRGHIWQCEANWACHDLQTRALKGQNKGQKNGFLR